MNQHDREIASAIPDLRRYARALTGTTERGDTYVRACLETLVAEPERLNRSSLPRKDLFAAFHEVWDGVGQTFGTDQYAANAMSSHDRAYRRSSAELDRQVLLLVTVEGFSTAEAATILGIDEATVRARLDGAKAQMAKASKGGRVLIIEDEPVIAMDLAEAVKSWGHAVVGVAASRKSALALASAHHPNIVLSDIQLKGGEDGLEAAGDVQLIDNATVIFITGYPERLLTGEGPEPAFVMAKPFQREKLKTVIDQALWLRQPAAAAA